MSKPAASYPTTVWTGATPSRSDPNGDNVEIYRKPDPDDWQKMTTEVIAIQSHLNSGYAYPKEYVFQAAVGGNATVANDVAAEWQVVTRACQLVKAFVIAKTAPTGATLILDIKFSTDQGGTWTSLWATTTASRPTLAISGKYATTILFDTTTLAEGTILRIDVIQIGSGTAGRDISIHLLTRSQR